jgi:hypothetical protein
MASENIKQRKIYRICSDAANKIWDRIYFLTNAASVDANDGLDMETKVGAVKGITTSTNVTEKGYAADATVVKELNDSLGGLRFGTNGEGNYGYFGADDSFIPFSSDLKFRVFYEAITNTEKSFTVDGTIKFVSFAYPDTNGRGYYDSNKSTTSWYDFNNVEKHIGSASDVASYLRIVSVTGDTVTFRRNQATTTKTFVIVGYSPSGGSLPIPSVVDTVKFLGSAKHDQGKLGELFTATKGMGPFTIITNHLRLSYFTIWVNDVNITDTNYITRKGIESELNNSSTVLGYVTVTYPLNEGDVVAVKSGSGGSGYTFALSGKIANLSS